MKNKLPLLLVLSAVIAGCQSPSQETTPPIRDDGITRIEKYITDDLRFLAVFGGVQNWGQRSLPATK